MSNLIFLIPEELLDFLPNAVPFLKENEIWYRSIRNIIRGNQEFALLDWCDEVFPRSQSIELNDFVREAMFHEWMRMMPTSPYKNIYAVSREHPSAYDLVTVWNNTMRNLGYFE